MRLLNAALTHCRRPPGTRVTRGCLHTRAMTADEGGERAGASAGAVSAGGRRRAKEPTPKPVQGITRFERRQTRPPVDTQLEIFQVTADEFARRVSGQLEQRTLTRLAVKEPGATAADKHHALASYHVNWGRTLFLCKSCFLLPGECVCGRVARVHVPHKVVVLFHHTEWGRASNTGCLLMQALGPECVGLVRGIKNDDARLAALLRDPDAPPLLLFPSESALLPAEALSPACIAAQRAALGASPAPAAPAPGPQRRTLVVVDGTWSNAQRIARTLPAAPALLRVRLPVEAVGTAASLLRPVRAYHGDAQLGRVCTLEAVVALLRALGQPEADCCALLDGLRMKVDALRRQKGAGDFYGTGTGGDGGSEEEDGDGDDDLLR